MGPVETAVRTAIEKLDVLTGNQPVFAEVALALARKLDHPENFKGPDPTAHLARELRETMAALAPGGENDALVAAYAEFTAALSTPVQHTTNTGKGNSRTERGSGSNDAGFAADAVATLRPGRST